MSETAARRAKMSSISIPWGRNGASIYATSGTLENGQVGSQSECQGPWASCVISAQHFRLNTY